MKYIFVLLLVIAVAAALLQDQRPNSKNAVRMRSAEIAHHETTAVKRQDEGEEQMTEEQEEVVEKFEAVVREFEEVVEEFKEVLEEQQPALSRINSFYDKINGKLCISAEFTETRATVRSQSLCASHCTSDARCAAFTLANGPCQLFVFDRCSKHVVSNCNCTQTGHVFVKRLPGVPPGTLCPSSYSDYHCGVKYKLYSVQHWGPGRALCESQPGLVIMSDVIDTNEMSHVNYIDNKYSSSGIGDFFVGGYQRPGSSETSGGWYWVSCNITFDPVLWQSGEPNNLGGNENVPVKEDGQTGLSDYPENSDHPNSVLCECLDPFN